MSAINLYLGGLTLGLGIAGWISMRHKYFIWCIFWGFLVLGVYFKTGVKV